MEVKIVATGQPDRELTAITPRYVGEVAFQAVYLGIEVDDLVASLVGTDDAGVDLGWIVIADDGDGERCLSCEEEECPSYGTTCVWSRSVWLAGPGNSIIEYRGQVDQQGGPAMGPSGYLLRVWGDLEAVLEAIWTGGQCPRCGGLVADWGPQRTVCRCGLVPLTRCAECGTLGQQVLVEEMPEWLIASHEAAGNYGRWPHNGAIRRSVCAECADMLTDGRHEPDSASRYSHIVGGE